MTDDDELSPQQELHGISVALRAYVEWHDLAGTTGFPREVRSAVRAQVDVAEPSIEAEVEPTADARPQEPAAKLLADGMPTEALEQAFAPASTPAPASRRAALPATCAACERGDVRHDTLEERGNQHAHLCFVTDADAFAEGATELLAKMIRAMKLSPDADVRHVVLARAPHKEHTCASPLELALLERKPRVLVAFGAGALAALLGQSTGFTKLRGQWKLYRGEILLMPTHGVGAMLEPGRGQQEAKREAWIDLQAVMKELAGAS